MHTEYIQYTPNTIRAVFNPTAGAPLDICRETHTEHIHVHEATRTLSSMDHKTACRDCCGLRVWLNDSRIVAGGGGQGHIALK